MTDDMAVMDQLLIEAEAMTTVAADVIRTYRERTHAALVAQVAEQAAEIARLQAEVHGLKWGPEHLGHAIGRDLLADAGDEIARLREALQMMVDAEVDYMRLNSLGDPEKQHRIKVARAALGEPRHE
jgi:cell division protein FtsB